MNGPQDDQEFEKVGRFILESLKILNTSVKELQDVVTELRVTLGNRSGLLDELRADVKELEKKSGQQDRDLTELKVKAAGIAFVAAALMSYVMSYVFKK